MGEEAERGTGPKKTSRACAISSKKRTDNR